MAKVKPVTAVDIVRLIKKEKCLTLSGKSEIIYCLGSDSDDRLMIRIYSNTGGGFFSDEWVAVSKILDTLESWNPDKPITSVVLGGLLKGKSINTPAFLMAALRSEGVLSAIDGKQRCHELGDTDAFLAQAKALQSGKSKAPPKVPPKAKAAKIKPAKVKPAPKSKKKSA